MSIAHVKLQPSYRRGRTARNEDAPVTGASGAVEARSLRARLREETRDAHRALEERLDVLAPALSMARYTAIVRAFHGYYRSLEDSLAMVAPRVGFPLLRRTPLLARDLAALGISRDELQASASCTDLPRVRDGADLAGCVYVIEGACLGGRVIARAVGDTLGLTVDTGACFFASDGADPVARWRSVLAWPQRFSVVEDADRIVTSAQETFGSIERWLDSRGVLR